MTCRGALGVVHHAHAHLGWESAHHGHGEPGVSHAHLAGGGVHHGLAGVLGVRPEHIVYERRAAGAVDPGRGVELLELGFLISADLRSWCW